MTAWCIVAYRVSGRMEIFGPYELRGIAATYAVMLASSATYAAAYVHSMTEPPKGT